MPERPEVPAAMIHRLDGIFAALPETYREGAWVGERWRVGQATVAHVFGGEDQQFRIVFRAPDSEVMTFEHLGVPYFKAGWGSNVVGVVIDADTDWDDIDADTDWDDLAEMLTDSYCIQAPVHLVSLLGDLAAPS
ncbi:MmcQ/YjbR family DNA-binding protein [Ornithinimicrobium ciconiae]|uniref:MmcQ/YjbR family DNA-binding protein n=1 Tax=Ornithinimicrobium ciconiae TaxID=2594265 RepID=A0A516GB36_9MICO|nr:MmcQ/YjbR family DNA-binding protein [Ornithinimicrobium ciconiae]QDO88729.1 MmcQ/YjbR family DNA-binding protein [Ornithinimicrobium ciconiae]